jgi:hypothetical protein
MSDAYYLIDSQLSVRSLTSYLSPRGEKGSLPAGQDSGQVVGNAGRSALPFTLDGQLRPGELYESSADPHVRFYLPRYRLNLVDGRYTTRLQWRDARDDPNGPLAFLTVEVAAIVPPAGSFILQEIPHQTIARLAYRMRLEDHAVQPAVNQISVVRALDDRFGSFLGNWTNVDLNTNGMTRLEVLSRDDQSATFHGFGKCHPQDCDWGFTGARPEGDALVGVYDFGFKTTRITARRVGNLLKAIVFDHYAPNDGRTDHTNEYSLSGGGQQGGGANDAGSVLRVEVGALEPVGSGVRRARLAISSKPDFDRLYQVMTDSSFGCQLEIHCFAAAARRTWRQLVLGTISFAAQTVALKEKKVLFTEVLGPRSSAPAQEVETPGNTRKVIVANRAIEPMRSTDAIKFVQVPDINLVRGMHPAVAAPRLMRVAVPGAAATSVLERSAVQEMAVQPVLARAYARPLPEVIQASDISTKVGQVRVKAAPVKAIVDEDGQPALLRIPIEAVQQIDPFWFLVATNAYMFDIPGDMLPTGHHILIPIEVLDGSGQVLAVFYQDSAYADRFYYQPQEFRVPRTDAPPYLPDLRILFIDLVTQSNDGNDDEAILNYKVRIAYRLLPHIDPLLLDLAQQQVPDVEAKFSALAPESASLSLKVPEDETGGVLTDVPRPAVEVHFDQGVVDEIELSRTEFERIFAFFQSPSGVGIDGAVHAGLLGNLTTSVPVRLSLKQNAGVFFGHTFLGPLGNGIYRVRLYNRIESPVTIEALYRVTLGGGVFAFPQATPGQIVQPGGQLDLDYRVDPDTAVVVDISPALSTSIDADPRRLWPLLFVNQGYTTDTFTVHLSVEPEFFGVTPPGGSDPLTGVQIEFEGAATRTLSPALLEADIDLYIPLLPRLLGDPQAKMYRYRVTNLLGADGHAGAKTDWMNGDGGAPLTIVPAGV